jgi:hypothetical protein
VATWPTLADYCAYARIPDTLDDDAIEGSLAAVKAAVITRCPMLATVTDPDVPDDVRHAMLIWCNRLVARRNSPEGIVGSPEMGVASIGRWDPDVGRLLAPYTAAVLA